MLHPLVVFVKDHEGILPGSNLQVVRHTNPEILLPHHVNARSRKRFDRVVYHVIHPLTASANWSPERTKASENGNVDQTGDKVHRGHAIPLRNPSINARHVDLAHRIEEPVPDP